ncbi:MAG: hypothetical protein JSS09_03775 [Verrucomicrobia bacterium]|nr:hypothetical protein [Verrucomicrobiota bacterium]
MNINGFSIISLFFKNEEKTLNILSALGIIASIGFLGYQISSLYGRVTTNPTPETPYQPKKIHFIFDNARKPTQAIISPSRLEKLNDLKTLERVDFLSQENLSLEKIKIANDIKKHSDILKYIQKQTNKQKTKNALAALLTLLGIKPVLIFANEQKIDPELYKILSQKKEIQLKKFDWKMGRGICLANETPIELFNPRRFLKPLSNKNISLLDATIDCFIHQDAQQEDEMLSYLLGFGPTFESYRKHTKKTFTPENSIFSDTHYAELGKVFSTENQVELGFYFHQKQAEIASLKTEKDCSTPYNSNFLVEKILSQTGTPHVYDAISLRTEYSQKSLSLKKWILEEYFPEISLA